MSLSLDKNTIEDYISRQSLEEAPDLTQWGNEDAVLFVTVHGSVLYGFNHALSDDDYYVVTPFPHLRRRVRKHLMNGSTDAVITDFKSFQKLCDDGVPQALETMFSQTSRSRYFESYRQGYRANSLETVHRYLRTMKAFSFNETKVFKYQRHAMRLAINLEELLYTGRFNPTMSAENVERTARFAAYDKPEFLRELRAMSPIEKDWMLPE